MTSSRIIVTEWDVQVAAPHLNATQRAWVYESIVRGRPIDSRNPEFCLAVKDARTLAVCAA